MGLLEMKPGESKEQRTKNKEQSAAFICPRWERIGTPGLCMCWRDEYGVEGCGECRIWTVYVRRGEG